MANRACHAEGMSTPEPTQEQRYERIARLRDQLDEIDRTRSEVLAALHREVHAAFPENRGGSEKRGVLAEVSRRSRYSREHVAKIRDSKSAGGKSSG